MAAIAMVVKKRQDEAKPLAALNDKRHALEQEGADAFAKARPSWKEVRKQLETKGVDTGMSCDREKELHDILAQPAFTSMLVRTQHTVRQNMLCNSTRPSWRSLADRALYQSRSPAICAQIPRDCTASTWQSACASNHRSSTSPSPWKVCAAHRLTRRASPHRFSLGPFDS